MFKLILGLTLLASCGDQSAQSTQGSSPCLPSLLQLQPQQDLDFGVVDDQVRATVQLHNPNSEDVGISNITLRGWNVDDVALSYELAPAPDGSPIEGVLRANSTAEITVSYTPTHDAMIGQIIVQPASLTGGAILPFGANTYVSGARPQAAPQPTADPVMLASLPGFVRAGDAPLVSYRVWAPDERWSCASDLLPSAPVDPVQLGGALPPIHELAGRWAAPDTVSPPSGDVYRVYITCERHSGEVLSALQQVWVYPSEVERCE